MWDLWAKPLDLGHAVVLGIHQGLVPGPVWVPKPEGAQTRVLGTNCVAWRSLCPGHVLHRPCPLWLLTHLVKCACCVNSSDTMVCRLSPGAASWLNPDTWGWQPFGASQASSALKWWLMLQSHL